MFLFYRHQCESPMIFLIGGQGMFRQRAVSPAVITGYTLLFHINTYFNEITWSDIVDVGHAAYYIFSLCLVVVGNLFGGEISPLARTVNGFFRIKVLYRIAQCIETDGLSARINRPFPPLRLSSTQRVSVRCPFSCGRT